MEYVFIFPASHFSEQLYVMSMIQLHYLESVSVKQLIFHESKVCIINKSLFVPLLHHLFIKFTWTGIAEWIEMIYSSGLNVYCTRKIELETYFSACHFKLVLIQDTNLSSYSVWIIDGANYCFALRVKPSSSRFCYRDCRFEAPRYIHISDGKSIQRFFPAQ